MNKHFKAIYRNVLKHGCKISFKDNTIFLDAQLITWQARIKDGKYFYNNRGSKEKELLK